MTSFSELLADLDAETRSVDAMVTGLSDADWDKPTPAPGWSITDQISHLAYFDEAALRSASHPERFRTEAARLIAVGPSFPDEIARWYRATPPPELLRWFRDARAQLIKAVGRMDPKMRVPWYGPDMSLMSSMTARLMETWAHGQDIADALELQREPTARLQHVAHLGIQTMGFSFGLHGKPIPAVPVYVELVAPDGTTWTWGRADAHDRVHGPALDFCLVVTQRRHLADTGLRVTGAVAAEWMSIAQAFAGSPGTGREPGEFARKERTA